MPWTSHGMTPLKITQDVRDYAAQQGLITEDALSAGLEEKAREFRETGGEIYVPQA
jgi:phosphomethylpyrimidine synthase